MKLGELKPVPVRQFWTNEARDFTPWLAQNIQSLNGALGLELEIESVEVACGPFSADILAKDAGTDQYVVIENQLEKTDHDHLGKAITYASVLNASAVVWVATTFTEEHKKALDWLNDHTTEEISFYGVQVELWQIDDSAPAVRFNVVSSPNEAVRQAAKTKANEEMTDARRTQLQFWTVFSQRLLATKQVMSVQTPRAQYWYNVSLGKSNIELSNTCNTDTNTVAVRVYIGNKIADTMLPYLESRKAEIEAQIGAALEWNPNPGNRDKIITLSHNTDFSNPAQVSAAQDWLVAQTLKFRSAFAKAVKEYRAPVGS